MTADKQDPSAPTTRLSINRITAATLVTLAANSVARIENTDEGTPSRRASLTMSDKCFTDLKVCADRNRTDDPAVAQVLDKGVEAYRFYLTVHKRADALEHCDTVAFKAACAEGDRALDTLDEIMGKMLSAF
jgi:hypothetical protein